jgi:YD repeat-containing protein
MLLCGKTLYLRRDATTPNKFQTLDKEWTGVMDGDQITISRADGWELQYVQGKLRQLKTDKGRRLTWVYNGGLATEIREDGNGGTASPLQVVMGDSGIPRGIIVNGKEHRFELEKRPIVKNESGMNVVEQLQPSLASWTWPDGKWESYEFAVTPEVVPTLKVTNAEKVATTYTWDPKNGHILSDGEWTYQIGEVSKPYDLPRIERTNAKGEKEFTYTDQKAGITDRQTLEDGHRVTQVFSSPGNLYGKVRKIEQVDPKGNKTPVLQLSYDEQGRLYRKIDDSGFATIYKYKKDGRLESKVHVSSQNSKELDVEKNNLISAVMNSRTNVERGDATEALALFYIYKLHNFSEAQKLLPLMNNKKQIFNLKWRLIAESSKSSVDKIREINALAKEYPEKQRLLGIITDNITN